MVEQQTEARSIRGVLVKSFAEKAAEKAVQPYVEDAAGSAAAAKKSEEAAAKSAQNAADSEANAADSAQHAEDYSGKPPIIKDGNWWTWNADEQNYTDTGEPSRGNLMYAVFWVDATTGDLYMYTDDEYTGPGFRLNGNELEVVLDAGRTA